MTRLVINARHGVQYRAEAWIETDSGSVLAEGQAVLAPLPSYTAVDDGAYLYDRTCQFPANRQMRMVFGGMGVIFLSASDGKPVLVHGGVVSAGGLLGTPGSIRCDQALMEVLLRCAAAASEDQAEQLALTVQVGVRPSRLKFWAQPRAEHYVDTDDDDDVPIFRVASSEFAMYSDENSAVSWLRYFADREQSPPIVSGGGGDFGGGGASGSWDGDPSTGAPAPVGAQDPVDAAAGAGALFQLGALPGVDASGRLVPIDDSDASLAVGGGPVGHGADNALATESVVATEVVTDSQGDPTATEASTAY